MTDRANPRPDDDSEEKIPAAGDGPKSILETVTDPDVPDDTATQIEEEGAPFEGSHA